MVDPDGVYSRVSKEISPGTPLLELPVVGEGTTAEIRHISTLKIATDHLLGSTLHWGRLVDGYGSQTTKDYIELLYLDIVVQNELRNPMFIIRFAKRKGIPYLLIHLNDYNSSVRKKWIQVLDELDAKTIIKQGDVILVHLN
jgi:hypothetical protein